MGRSWTFGRKLAAGFAVVALLSLLMGLISFIGLRQVVTSKDRVIDGAAQDLIDAESLRAAANAEVAQSRGYLLTKDEAHRVEIRAANDEWKAALGRIRARGLSPEGERLVRDIEEAEKIHQAGTEAVLALRAGDAETAQVVARFNEQVAPSFRTKLDKVRAFAERQRSSMQAERQQASDEAATVSLAVMGLGGVCLALALLAAVVLSRTLGQQIASSVQHVRSASTELQAAATQQASGAQEQATAMNQVTTTLTELLSTSRQIAESAQRVAQIASGTAENARTGDRAVGRTKDSMGQIRQQVDVIVQHMLELGDKSQRIGEILEIVSELAEQTNILAINATIEASGAGEAGRRFAVVGDEIRKLADRVSASTKSIRGLIEEIRASVNSTVMATETGSKTVQLGAERTRELAEAFGQIGEQVERTRDAAREIELSTKQQTTAVEQVNVAIANVAQATREAEATSSQTLQTAAQLSSLSGDLARLVQAQAGAG